MSTGEAGRALEEGREVVKEPSRGRESERPEERSEPACWGVLWMSQL